MSTHEYRRRTRRLGLLIGAALVAITIAGLAASKAQALTWGFTTEPTPRVNVSANALTQGPTSAVALGGFTSQGWPVVFELGRGGKLVTLVGTGLDMTCTSGDQFSVEDGWQLINIAKNGKVHTTEQIPASGDTVTGGSHSLIGRFDRHRLTFRGVWRMQLNFKNADGTTDQCQSGSVRLIATL